MRFCYQGVQHDGKNVLARLDFGEAGYTACPEFGEFDSLGAAERSASVKNRFRGVTEPEEHRIVGLGESSSKRQDRFGTVVGNLPTAAGRLPGIPTSTYNLTGNMEEPVQPAS